MMKDWKGNYHSIYTTLGASNHSNKEREKDDFYATDPHAIDCLESEVKLPKVILEPACGAGHLSMRLEQLGHEVISTDKVGRGYGSVKDFFSYTWMPQDCNCIVTNPPYRFASEFVLHALNILPSNGILAMFLKTTFLEGQERWKKIFSKTPPTLVLQFVKRIKCAKNGDFDLIGSSAASYAWFVWLKGVDDTTKIKWINT